MNHYLIVCRSVTQAQRTGRLLTSAGITNQIFRAPAGLVDRGCSYVVRVRADHAGRAMQLLQANKIIPVKVVEE